MNPNRKLWNEGHQKLRRTLATNDHKKALELFLSQHAMIHSAKVSRSKLWSFEDEILNDMTEDQIRCIPPKGEHSIAWIIFHLARVEDITMNMLVAGTPQLFLRDQWAGKLNVNILHSANKMSEASVVQLSGQIAIQALRAYRQAVGRQTRAIVKKIKPTALKQKVDSLRLKNIIAEGAVTPEAMEIANYWGSRTIAGLLLMPATRHNFLHLYEALRIKQKVRR